MKTILVLDDEPKITQLVRDYLERAGFDVLIAHDGKKALSLAKTEKQLNLTGPKPDVEGTFQAAVKAGVNGLIINRDAVTASYLKQIADLAIKHRLPSMNEDTPYVEAGGLMSYASNDAHQFRRAAYYVDKILKGTKPAASN